MERPTRPQTISDLAARLGVSSMTVHRAIAGKPDIAPRTRARILREIEELGWRPNIAARGLRQGKTFTLGVLVSNMAASFLPEILQGVNRAAEARGCHTFVCVHEHDPDRARHHLHTLQSKGVDGIVYYPTERGLEAGTEAALLNDLARSTPLVAIMREVPGFTGPVVRVNDALGGRQAAEHLLSLGHTRFGFLGYGAHDLTDQRRRGFEAALRERGLTLRPEWTAAELTPGDDAARGAAKRILAQPDRPTALFCTSDRLAARAIQAAGGLGLRVPEALSVVGYNNDAWGRLLPVPLTTVAQPREQVGERAAELALNGSREENAEPPTAPHLALDSWLEVRNSTGPVRQSAVGGRQSAVRSREL